MRWHLSDDVRALPPAAHEVLARRPVDATVALTVLAALRAGRAFSATPPLLGWCEDDGDVVGVVVHTPPWELVLAHVPPAAVEPLADALLAHRPQLGGVLGEVPAVEAVVAAWTARVPVRATTVFEERLFRLGTLLPPEPAPAGRARLGTRADVDRVAEWFAAFGAEAGTPVGDAVQAARDRVADDLLWLWEDADGVPVAMAARHRPAGGVSRVGPVYTAPQARRRGCGAAVTAACAADALAAGAREVVLFTDLANPTSNAVYRRIGFVPVGDHRVVRFVPR